MASLCNSAGIREKNNPVRDSEKVLEVIFAVCARKPSPFSGPVRPHWPIDPCKPHAQLHLLVGPKHLRERGEKVWAVTNHIQKNQTQLEVRIAARTSKVCPSCRKEGCGGVEDFQVQHHRGFNLSHRGLAKIQGSGL
jgi:hypothetical protein